MKKLALLALSLGSIQCLAATSLQLLTADSSHLEFCLKQIPLEDGKDRFNIRTSILRSYYPKAKEVRLIEINEGELLAHRGDYSGPYSMRVYLVKAFNSKDYPLGVWERISITQYTATGAIEVHAEALNHLGSSELSQQRCDQAFYQMN